MADVGNAISPDMIRSILSMKGGADTPQNIASIKSFIASNPQQAERYAMGMRGGSNNDDNMDILQLEKQMDKTNGIATPASVPDEVQSAQQPQAAAPRVAAPAPKLAPMQGPQLPMASGKVNPLDSAPQRGVNDGDGGVLPWLIAAILGTGTGAAMYANRDPVTQKRIPPSAQQQIEGPGSSQKRIGFEPKLEDTGPNAYERASKGGAEYEGGAPTIDRGVKELKDANYNATKGPVQAEVAAENEAAARLQEQMLQRRAGQNSTRDLMKRARGVTGRK